MSFGREAREPVPAVGTVCFKGEDVLLIQRGTKPLKGDWSLPGGRIEPGERSADAALRELHEETCVEARIAGLVDVVDGIFHSRTSGDVTRHYVLFDYAAIWTAGEPCAGDDAAHAECISPEKLASLRLWDETRRIIEAARKIVLDPAGA